ncbi:MAG: PQQ-binding-like beta-propeller repeat protein [Bryobacteraceae bacterium]|nr:PQQ-binding-like beta-propeller repeat protein [Bryobacteraceae bacterium]
MLAILLLAQWPSYHGGPANTKYSTLSQITPANVAQLKVAWKYDSGDEFPGSEMQCNPIVVEGVLYATTPRLNVIALDAGTGAVKWKFEPVAREANPRKRRNRGVMYWRGQILFGFEHWLIRLDAKTGKEAGRIDLREGLGRDPARVNVSATTPGVLYGDLLILGHLTSEDLPAAPGDIRAFDLRTGKIAWTFHTLPHPNEFGHDTWPQDAWKALGGVNNWAGMALDEKRGIVFVPTGSASFDFYGANRHGDNLFANCLIALDAKTGKRLWHFQFVKHDVWDRDLPTAPTLVTVRREGKPIDAVAQITKSGHVFVFDRVTGKSLFPLEERAVPASDIEGELLAKTQWLPLAPPPFSRQKLTEDMVPEAMREKFRAVRSGDQFTPPSLEGTVIFPGFDGGGEWGGAAFDPAARRLYVNANEMAWILRIVPRPKARGVARVSEIYAANCAGCHRADRRGTPPEFPSLVDLKKPVADVESVVRKGAGRMPGYAQLGDDAVTGLSTWLLGGDDATVRVQGGGVGLKYSTDGYNKFLTPEGLPAIAPPWGTLTAIDLDSGNFAWRIPFGEFPQLADKSTGSENYGGAIITKNGLLFIAATNHDKKIRAFDKSTGKLLWQHELPAAGNATPALYMHGGREYLVIGAGGGKSKAPSGGAYVAFALP